MALKFPKLSIRTDAKTRLFLVLGAIVGISILIFAVNRFFTGKSVTGASKVAATPSGLQSVPGGQLSPEYYRAVMQANAQTAQQAQVSGTSAVPTLVRIPPAAQAQQQNNGSCTVLCPSGEVSDVSDDINNLTKQAKLAREDANTLLDLAKRNAPVSEFSAALNTLVQQKKLAPNDARRLLEEYQRQHVNAAVADSAAFMDGLIKSGELPLDVATQLLAMQKQKVSQADYAAALDGFVRAGKLSPQLAARLLDQYKQQQAQEVEAESASQLAQLAKSGQLPQDVASDLLDYQKRHAPASQYAAELSRLVAAGKITQAMADKLLGQYQRQTNQAAEVAGAGALGGLVTEAEAAAAADINNLVNEGKLPPDVAARLTDLQNKGASSQEYQDALNDLVQTGKITPAVAQQLMASYDKLQKAKANLNSALNNMVVGSKLSPDAAKHLADLQAQGVSPQEYKDALHQLVRAGNLTPAEAKKLAADYEKMQQGRAILKDDFNKIVAQGRLPSDVAARLADLENQGALPQQYKDALNQAVKEGKLMPSDAKVLAVDYDKIQGAKTDSTQGLISLVSQGKLLPDTAKNLTDLQNQGVSSQDYQHAVNQLVHTGKAAQGPEMTPEDAQQLLSDYELLKGAESDLDDLVKAGKLSPDAANHLLELQKSKVSPEAYQAALNQLVQDGKLAPLDAKRLMAAYQKLQNLRNESQKLAALRDNHATANDYANELRNAVQAGLITPDQSAKLLQDYQQQLIAAPKLPGAGAATEVALPGGGNAFANLQQRIAQQQAAVTPPSLPANAPIVTAQSAEAAVRQTAEEDKEKQERIQALTESMSAQAQSLIASWKPPVMQHKGGANETGATSKESATSSLAESIKNAAKQESAGPPIIKAGTIIFAVLDTAVNSDFPDTPVMATIIQGKFRGAKVLGKLALATGQDRLSLRFNLMDMDGWVKTKSISAFAIDPDTARTVMANEVDHHYMLRYGSIIATSFVSGYANAINTSGSTQINNISGVSTTHSPFSPQDKIAAGVGQVGTTLGNSMQNYFNTPTTVKINAGVAIGLLFMSDTSL